MTYRTSTIWKLGVAYEWQGDRAAAYQSYTEAISISQASGNIYTHILATVGLGNIQLSENQLHLASETYQHSLELVGDLPIPVAVHVHLCLARIFYQWNDLAAAQLHGQQSLQSTQPYKDQYDIYVASELFLARLKLAQGDVEGAVAILAEADQAVRQYNFVHQIPEVAAAKVRTLLYQGNLKAAANLAEKHVLPISLARVHLAQRKPSAALAILEPLRSEVEEKRWQDERLKVMVLQSVAHHANGEKEEAVRLLDEVLVLAIPGSFKRIFIDEGQSMAHLLQEALSRSNSPNYIRQLLAAFPDISSEKTLSPKSQLLNSELVEPLSERELEVLQLIAEGLTNPEIASKLYLSPNTVKVHTRNIYGKLDAHSRTQAVARARALSILSA